MLLPVERRHFGLSASRRPSEENRSAGVPVQTREDRYEVRLRDLLPDRILHLVRRHQTLARRLVACDVLEVVPSDLPLCLRVGTRGLEIPEVLRTRRRGGLALCDGTPSDDEA